MPHSLYKNIVSSDKCLIPSIIRNMMYLARYGTVHLCDVMLEMLCRLFLPIWIT